MKIGLRIDVDTFRGTKFGVPNLCKILSDYSIAASFFFSVGPDNMGRHLWRLLKPSFLRKMLRTKATSLYGWDVIFRGTFGQGPIIGEKLGNIICATANAGHEIGLHAWDHHAWQAHIDNMEGDAIYYSLEKGVKMLANILGFQPVCSAVPAWKCNNSVLMEKSKFPFVYNSDCRGESIFLPCIDGKELAQPQIPVTLPTYDEVIGQNGISNSNYNDYLLSQLKIDQLNVLTVHAEVEGITCAGMFGRFVKMAQSIGASFTPLGTLLIEFPPIERSFVVKKIVSGRDGWISCQASM